MSIGWVHLDLDTAPLSVAFAGAGGVTVPRGAMTHLSTGVVLWLAEIEAAGSVFEQGTGRELNGFPASPPSKTPYSG